MVRFCQRPWEGNDKLCNYILWIISSAILLVQSSAREDCIASLRLYEEECRDYQMSYVTTTASDPSLLSDGSISSRGNMLCSRCQAADQPLVVQVWRRDAGFRLVKQENKWVAAGLRPGEKQRVSGAIHVLDNGLWLGEVRIADILEGKDESNQYVLKEFKVDDDDSTRWIALVARPNLTREWQLTLDSKQQWLCTEVTTYNQENFVRSRSEFDNRLRSLLFEAD